jgi:hypothetical protein
MAADLDSVDLQWKALLNDKKIKYRKNSRMDVIAQ